MTPIQSSRSLRSESGLLEFLNSLASPHFLIHIGAGTGQGPLHQWQKWNVPKALIVESDPARLGWAQQLAASHPEWQTLNAVLADSDGPVTFFSVSNPAEDGLVSADNLRPLWPNLRNIKQEQREALRLDTLMSRSADLGTSRESTWLLVDLLPALSILKGAPETLKNSSVIVVRTLLAAVPGVGSGSGATLEELETFLRTSEFKCVGIVEDNQPAIGYAFFIRNWQLGLQRQLKANKEQRRLNSECQATLASLQRQNEESTAELTRQRDAEIAAKAKALAQRDEFARNLQEREHSLTAFQAQNETLKKENARLLAEHQDLNAAKTEAIRQRDREAKAKAASEALRTSQAEKLTEAIALREACDKVVKERDASLKLLQDQLNKLAHEKVKLVADHKELAAEKSQANTSRVQEAKAKAEAILQRDAHARTVTEQITAILDLKGQVSELRSERSRLIALQQDQLTTISTLTKQVNVEEAAKSEVTRQLEREAKAKELAQTQVRSLEQSKKESIAQHDGLTKENAQLTAKLEAEKQLVAERGTALSAIQARLLELEQERGTLVDTQQGLQKDCTDLLAQREAEIAAKLIALGQRDAQANLAEKRQDALKSLMDEGANLRQRIRQLEDDLRLTTQRHQQLQEQLVRGEAQVELIKDLLLREPGL